jgi:hypothetical protein
LGIVIGVAALLTARIAQPVNIEELLLSGTKAAAAVAFAVTVPAARTPPVSRYFSSSKREAWLGTQPNATWVYPPCAG